MARKSAVSSSRYQKAARLAARAADDKKARDIRLWDLRDLAGVSDFVLITTCDSSPQILAVEGAIETSLKTKLDLAPNHREGRSAATWKVVDYGNLVVHIFHENARTFFGLERLWEGARSIRWR